jgi:voltage-gated potassium channel
MDLDIRRWIYRNLIPTRYLYERMKARRQNEGPEKAATFARRWPSYLLAMELVVAIGLSAGTLSEIGSEHYILVRWMAYVAWIFAISRVAEIVGAYYYDAMDSFAVDRGPASLSKPDRINLVMKSYPSLVIDWAVIYFVLPSSQFLAHAPDGSESYALQSFIDAIYFSGVTIATVGYGDIAPTGPWSRLLSICEVWTGILVLVFALCAYLAAPTTPSRKRNA